MKKILFVLILFCSICLFGQTPLRLEFESAKDFNDYCCQPIGKNGVIVFYETGLLQNDSVIWNILQYDTNLQKKSHFPLILPDKLDFLNIYYAANTNIVYFLFQDSYRKTSKQKKYILKYDINNDKSNIYCVKELNFSSINFFRVYDDNCYIITFEKEQYHIYKYDINTDYFTEVNFSPYPIVSIEFCENDTLINSLQWGIIFQESPNLSYTEWITSDYNGNTVQRQKLPFYSKYSLQASRFSIVDTANYLILGTYINDNTANKSKLYSGVYTLPIKNNVMGELNFYDYVEIKNKTFVGSNKRQSGRVENLYEIISPIFSQNGQFSIVSEQFYPEYTQDYNRFNDPYYYNNYYGSYFNRFPVTTFSGYRFVNAFILTFDSNGKLTGNHYIPFSNLLTDKLESHIIINQFNEYALLFFSFNNKVSSLLFFEDQIIEPLQSFRIMSKNKSDEIQYNKENKFVNWYDNYYLAYGYQFIKNKEQKKSGNKRYIFYLNKIGYR